MFRALTSGHLVFPPLSLRVTWNQSPTDRDFDGSLHVRWDAHGLEAVFAFAVKTRWTPLALRQFADRARSLPAPVPRPLVILPYLSEAHLTQLQEYGLSGLDLCGNGLLLDPPRLFILRIGGRSRFPTASATPSIYHNRNLSSLVPRSFLLQPNFASVQAVLDACRDRMMRPLAEPPPLSLPTVSRALAQLEQDLAITRKGRSLSLADPIRLLEGLERSFQPPVTTGSCLGKTGLPLAACWSALRAHRGLKAVLTGRGSATRYTGLAGPQRLALYVSDLEQAQRVLDVKPTVAFPNIELLESNDEAVYFDSREQDGAWASPIQTYLELAHASPRERDVAEGLRKQLLTAPP